MATMMRLIMPKARFGIERVKAAGIQFDEIDAIK
jgi:hypothetical protein